mmetsp:Transcript_98451/g.263219  ORF Transcript_98451/g.263219 Transcript_98451/m.263219 type:complete len:220 (-) Transcript_98451:178-837(-)
MLHSLTQFTKLPSGSLKIHSHASLALQRYPEVLLHLFNISGCTAGSPALRSTVKPGLSRACSHRLPLDSSSLRCFHTIQELPNLLLPTPRRLSQLTSQLFLRSTQIFNLGFGCSTPRLSGRTTLRSCSTFFARSLQFRGKSFHPRLGCGERSRLCLTSTSRPHLITQRHHATLQLHDLRLRLHFLLLQVSHYALQPCHLSLPLRQLLSRRLDSRRARRR